MSQLTLADPAFEPLTTDRLIVRAPSLDDLDALVARRNHPDVAFYQDWPIPYPAGRAADMLDRAVAQGGLIDGKAWMVTVELRETGQPIGDLYIGVESQWRTAELGYSLDPEFWGQGYASEAVDAVLNHLFEELGIQRVSATLHPANIASAMVLERAGFLWEGQTKLSCWIDDRPEPENSDDGLYGLTVADRRAWVGRPTGPPNEVGLADVTRENQRQVEKIVTHKSQERLVATVLESFADALLPPVRNGQPRLPRMWVIEADGNLAGFVMIAEATEHHPEPYLWRLLIDRRHQRRGIGGRALDLVEAHCREAGNQTIMVNWSAGRGSPGPFYQARGYEPTGAELNHNQVEGRKQL